MNTLSPIHIVLAGGFAGAISWGLCYPGMESKNGKKEKEKPKVKSVDVVKTRYQTQPDISPPKFSSLLDCAVKTYREGGPKIFLRGITPTLIRSFPVNAAIFLLYEVVVDLLDKTI